MPTVLRLGSYRFFSMLVTGMSLLTCILSEKINWPSLGTIVSGYKIGARLTNPTCQESEVKTTEYFKYMRKRPDRATIEDEWITHVIQFPRKIEIESDGRIRKWGWIKEEDGFLRVILLEDRETVHNAFFDRSFKEKVQ